jgi:hypothetical protein
MWNTFLWNAGLYDQTTTVQPPPIPLPENYLREFMNDMEVSIDPNEE